MCNYSQFENSQVKVECLPNYELIDLIPLEKNYLKVNMIACSIWAVLLIAVFTILTFIISGSYRGLILLLIALFMSILILLPFIVSYFGYFQKAYVLRERDIIYRKGLFWRSTIVIPFNRIQHSEVNHGPIDRYFGLASLKVFTAGGSASDLEIPGLTDHRAHQLKEYITRKTGMDEEE